MLEKSVINFVVTIGNISYILGMLSINHNKKEFSYHFTYPSNSPNYHLNYNSGDKTLRMDHVTWHANKNQIRLKQPTSGKYPNPIFPIDRKFILHRDLKLNADIEPFYIESIYFSNQDPCLLKQINHTAWINSINQEIFNVDTSYGFSMVLFLVSSKESTTSLLQKTYVVDGYVTKLENLIDEHHRTGRILLYDNWDVLVLVSPLLITSASPIPAIMQPSFRCYDYIEPLSSLVKMMFLNKTNSNNVCLLKQK